jgi:TusA-related sulfurtransferase
MAKHVAPGAIFEILVDGKPRSYRDIKQIAIESAEYLKIRNPNCEVAMKDLQSGEVIPITFKPERS